MKTEKILLEVQRLINKYNLTKQSRLHQYTFRRYYICNFLRINTELTLRQIADLFNYKDHASAIWSAQKHSDFMYVKDEKYMRLTEPIRLALTVERKPIDIDEATRELIRASQLKLN